MNAMPRNRSLTRSPRRAAQSGFSLIEIIIVTVLIGGIVAFAATRILGGGDKAKYNLAKSQVQTMAEKIESYRMDTGGLPNSLEDLVKAPSNANGWLGPYAKEKDLKDPWGAQLQYQVPGDNQPFNVSSYGADGKPGGESVNGDIKNE
jgi:general secretion pathway protein G